MKPTLSLAAVRAVYDSYKEKKEDENKTMTLRSTVSGDARLGMNDAITRRDFLGSTLLASGALLFKSITPAELLAAGATGAAADEFTGYGGVGEYSTSNGNTLAVLEAGHTIRDGVYDPLSRTSSTLGRLMTALSSAVESADWPPPCSFSGKRSGKRAPE